MTRIEEILKAMAELENQGPVLAAIRVSPTYLRQMRREVGPATLLDSTGWKFNGVPVIEDFGIDGFKLEYNPPQGGIKANGFFVPALWGKSIAEQLRDQQRFANVIAYGMSHPEAYVQPSRWKRLRWRIEDLRERVRGAWLVLIGRAHIGDD